MIKDDTELLQSALDRGGSIELDRTYHISSPLTIHGDTKIVGTDGAKIIWHGDGSESILRDSSVTNPALSNRNIMLQNFEIVGNGADSANKNQNGIEFYRTGHVTFRDLVVHGVGGSGIRWGNSHQDSTNILVENCRVYGCRFGDAIQGSGRNIVIRNNLIGHPNSDVTGFGDSGIALLMDFSSHTNPGKDHSAEVVIERNTIVGDHSPNRPQAIAQTGIAAGPFASRHMANVRIARNTVSRCYVNIWLAVMQGVEIVENLLLPHASRLTANLRLDGISDVRISGNNISLSAVGSSVDYCCLMLNAQRNTYGASSFDADVSRFHIENNTFESTSGATGIRFSFGRRYKSPSYISRISDGMVCKNTFTGINEPISLAPSDGESPDTFSSVIVSENIADAQASALVNMAGNPDQYNHFSFHSNKLPAGTPLRIGTGK